VGNDRCMWHLAKSLGRNLQPKLKQTYKEFISRWYKLNTIVGMAPWKAEWEKLLEDFPAGKEYLTVWLGGENFEHWATPFQVRRAQRWRRLMHVRVHL
jgi:hypothetical protein